MVPGIGAPEGADSDGGGKTGLWAVRTEEKVDLRWSGRVVLYCRSFSAICFTSLSNSSFSSSSELPTLLFISLCCWEVRVFQILKKSNSWGFNFGSVARVCSGDCNVMQSESDGERLTAHTFPQLYTTYTTAKRNNFFYFIYFILWLRFVLMPTTINIFQKYLL